MMSLHVLMNPFAVLLNLLLIYEYYYNKIVHLTNLLQVLIFMSLNESTKFIIELTDLSNI